MLKKPETWDPECGHLTTPESDNRKEENSENLNLTRLPKKEGDERLSDRDSTLKWNTSTLG